MLAAITVVLLAGVPAAVAVPMLVPLLAPLGIPAPAVVAAADLLLPHVVPPAPGDGEPGRAASAWARRTEPARQAAYLLRAAQRFAKAAGATPILPGQDPLEQQAEGIARAIRPADVARERRYLQQQLDATRRRIDAAERVDRAAGLRGGWLGWHAILDERTTAECRAAHGHNFNAGRPPTIGYPGMPHGGTCRCRPGPPHVSDRTVDEAVRAAGFG